jgi:GNAT superfamily N-acetyltransferase
MTYRIREVDGADEETRELLREMHTLCFADTAPQIAPEEGYWWIAYHGSEPVAFAGLEASHSVADAGYLCRSGVLPEHRGHGLQVRLLRVREAKARRLGWTVLRSDTTDNIPSANSLIRAGFKLFAPAYPWAFADTLYWKKQL